MHQRRSPPGDWGQSWKWKPLSVGPHRTCTRQASTTSAPCSSSQVRALLRSLSNAHIGFCPTRFPWLCLKETVCHGTGWSRGSNLHCRNVTLAGEQRMDAWGPGRGWQTSQDSVGKRLRQNGRHLGERGSHQEVRNGHILKISLTGLPEA